MACAFSCSAAGGARLGRGSAKACLRPLGRIRRSGGHDAFTERPGKRILCVRSTSGGLASPEPRTRSSERGRASLRAHAPSRPSRSTSRGADRELTRSWQAPGTLTRSWLGTGRTSGARPRRRGSSLAARRRFLQGAVRAFALTSQIVRDAPRIEETGMVPLAHQAVPDTLPSSRRHWLSTRCFLSLCTGEALLARTTGRRTVCLRGIRRAARHRSIRNGFIE